MKKMIAGVVRRLGYDIVRHEIDAPRDLVRECCDRLSLAMIPAVPREWYEQACVPLFPQPTPVPQSPRLKFYQSVKDTVHNISMQQYFHVTERGREFLITDHYEGSHYQSRQRMLYTVYRECIGDSLKGMSVLDVGCSAGYYSFFCGQLGASQVLGIDARPEHADQFALLRGMLSMPDTIRYQPLDMEFALESLTSEFDVVLAQGVMYHVYDHPRFVKNLHRLTRRVLVLEGACSGRTDMLCKADMEETTNLRASVHGPVLYPSIPWTVNLLHWAGFSKVSYIMYPQDIAPSVEHAGLWRAMLVAVKE